MQTRWSLADVSSTSGVIFCCPREKRASWELQGLLLHLTHVRICCTLSLIAL